VACRQHKAVKTLKKTLKKHLSSLKCRLLFIYEITPLFFGDRLLLQVVVLVNTTNCWSYEDTSCAEFCNNRVIMLSATVLRICYLLVT